MTGATPHPYDGERARRELAAHQRTLPVPPGHFWTTRGGSVALLRVIGPRVAELHVRQGAAPLVLQVVGLRRRRLRPSRVVLQTADGARTTLHVLLPGEASPAQIGHGRTKALPQWMVLDGEIGSDALDLVAAVFIGVARIGYDVAHLPSILARQSRRRAAAATVVAALG